MISGLFHQGSQGFNQQKEKKCLQLTLCAMLVKGKKVYQWYNTYRVDHILRKTDRLYTSY